MRWWPSRYISPKQFYGSQNTSSLDKRCRRRLSVQQQIDIFKSNQGCIAQGVSNNSSRTFFSQPFHGVDSTPPTLLAIYHHQPRTDLTFLVTSLYRHGYGYKGVSHNSSRTFLSQPFHGVDSTPLTLLAVSHHQPGTDHLSSSLAWTDIELELTSRGTWLDWFKFLLTLHSFVLVLACGSLPNPAYPTSAIF